MVSRTLASGSVELAPLHLFAAEATSPSSRGSERPFARHSRAPWVALRGRTNLRADVEAAVAGVVEGAPRERNGFPPPPRPRGPAPAPPPPRPPRRFPRDEPPGP